MSFRQFALGLTATFGLAWLVVVIIPFFALRDPQPLKFDEQKDNGKTGDYFPKSTGRIVDGARVYAANGCYQCHSQLIRPTNLGNDMGRKDWGGLAKDPAKDGADSRRETNVFDYRFENFAQIGVNRLGPDLMNIGLRATYEYATGSITPRIWILNHLYDPRAELDRQESRCPSFSFLFDKVKIEGQKPGNALDVQVEAGYAIVPSGDADALADYLLSMKHNEEVPAVINYAPKGPKAAAPSAAAPKKG